MEFLKLQFLPLGNVKKLCSISYKVYHRREMEKNVFFFSAYIQEEEESSIFHPPNKREKNLCSRDIGRKDALFSL
jgi:hypothetical protein